MSSITYEVMLLAVEHLFQEFLCLYPATKANFSTQSMLNYMQEFWARNLLDEGVTPEMFKQALDRSKKECREFMPSYPLFLDWCRPSLQSLGLPLLEDSYRIASDYLYRFNPDQTKPHVAILKAIKLVGEYNIIHGDPVFTRPQFEKAYKKVCFGITSEPNGLKLLQEEMKYITLELAEQPKPEIDVKSLNSPPNDADEARKMALEAIFSKDPELAKEVKKICREKEISLEPKRSHQESLAIHNQKVTKLILEGAQLYPTSNV